MWMRAKINGRVSHEKFYELSIKPSNVHIVMKTSVSTSFATTVPSLFQIAAFFEDFFPNRGAKQSVPPTGNLPFAEIMVSPEKLMTLLKSGKAEISASVVADPGQSQAKRAPAPKNIASKKQTGQGGQGLGKTNPSPNGSSKQIEFTHKSSSARSVKLAGDFTNWEKSPVEMTHRQDGVWSTVIPLEPGLYSYRFIVDGKWCDDPRSDHRVPNPFGGVNAVIHVT